MPGANCAFPDCGVTRREKFASLAIFQVPNRTGDFYTKWRKDILDVLLKYRGVDSILRDSEVDKLKNRANCDKSMKLGENTQFDMRNKIGYRPLLKNASMCYF